MHNLDVNTWLGELQRDNMLRGCRTHLGPSAIPYAHWLAL